MRTTSAVAEPFDVPLDRLRGRTSMKWRAFNDDVLPAWVAEMDVQLAPAVRDSIVAAAENGDTGYAVLDGFPQAFAGFAQRRWDWNGVDAARCAMASDVMVGVAEAITLVTAPGAAVLITPPVYPPFYGFVQHAGRQVVEVPLTADHRLHLDALADAFAASGRGSAFLLCSPHNPSGTVHTADELAAVAALATEHGVRVLVDEIHAPLVFAGPGFVPYLTVPGADDAIVVTSASKAWNLAGLKAALLVAGPEAADDLARLPEIVGHGPSHLGVLAQTAAWNDADVWLDRLVAGIAANHAHLRDALADRLPEATVADAQATFLAWCDLRAYGPFDGAGVTPGVVTDVVGPAARLVEHGRVAPSAGEAFGSGGAGHVRLNVGTSTAILDEVVARMARALR